MTKYVVFDGDDTLWVCQEYYTQAKEEFYALMAKTFGELLPAQDLSWFDISKWCDDVNLSLMETMKFSPERFPLSFYRTYRFICDRLSYPVDANILVETLRIGHAAVKHPPEWIDGAVDLLTELTSRGYILYLYTAGDLTIQSKKITHLRAERFFKHINITPDKNDDEMAFFLEDEDLDPHETVMVGNSLKSDILPALSCEMKAIWFRNGGWAYDNAGPPADIHIIESLPEVGFLLKHKLV